MSGQLASWVAEHSKASYRGRAVLMQYALAANHDGTPAADVTRDDLEHRTGLGRQTVIAGRKEVVERKELEELEAPGGRGKYGSYRVVVALCLDEAKCWSCDALAKALKRRRPKAESVPPTDGLEAGPEEENVRSIDGFDGGGETRNRPSQSRNRPSHGPTTVTGPTGLRGDGVPGAGSVEGGEDHAGSAAVASGGGAAAAISLPTPVPRGATDMGSPTTTDAGCSSTTVALGRRTTSRRSSAGCCRPASGRGCACLGTGGP